MKKVLSESEVARYYGDRLPRLRQQGKEWRGRCPIHDGKNENFTVNAESGSWYCHSKCNGGGSLIDLEMKLSGTEFKTAATEVDRIVGREPAPQRRKSGESARIVATYGYVDENGKLIYQSVRYEPKDFSQRKPDGKGGWINSVKGTRKVLYRLPAVMKADQVCIGEGEKDVHSLESLGFTATCNVGGAGKWLQQYAECLSGKRVVIFADNDEPGQHHARKVAESLMGIAAEVRYVPVPTGKDVTDWIEAGATKAEIEAAIAATKPMDQALAEISKELPTIQANNRQLPDITRDCIEALLRRNDPPSLFARVRSLVDIRSVGTAHVALNQLSDVELCGTACSGANFEYQRKNHAVSGPPPMHAVKDILALPNIAKYFPAIEGTTEIPLVRPDGSILDKPGYDAATRLYYVPAPGLNVPEIPLRPTQQDIDRALEFIDSGIGDFPFVFDLDSEGRLIKPDQRHLAAGVYSANKANALGCMLTAFVRPVINGPTPLALFDAPTPGTGKTLLAEVIAIASTGRPATLFSAPQNEEEWRKQITSYLYEGLGGIVIDNVFGGLHSAQLCKALTAVTWGDRILGKTQTALLPVRCLWIATGNNLHVTGDLTRRCYWVRLDARVASPHRRSGFRHANLRQWALDNRGNLVAALLVLARAWFNAGKPMGNHAPLGSYESWCQVIGGILENAGVRGFLANSVELHERVDPEEQQAESFLTTAARFVREAKFTSADFHRYLLIEPALRAVLPEVLAAVIDNHGSFQRKLGSYFAKLENRRYGTKQLFVTRAGTQHSVAVWRIIDPSTGITEVVQ